MSVNLYNSSVNTGLFNVLGAVFMAQADVNTARGTTVNFDLLRILDWFNANTPTSFTEPTVSGLTTAIPDYQSGSSSFQSTLQQFAQNYVIAVCAQDKTQPDGTLKTALQYIITQMLATAQTIDRSAVSLVITAGASNGGNGVIVTSTKRGDGLVQENTLSESIAVTCLSTSLTGSVLFTGQESATSALGQDWPLGSGINSAIGAVDANSSSLLTNGGMETQANLSNVPDSWILSVGTPGTHCLMTANTVQTIAIAGTPTSGGYTLTFTHPATGKKQTTGLIAYNAAGSAVQTALNALTGLASVVAGTDSGTTPNYTHQITFTGMGGSVPLLAASNYLSGGSPTITIAITTVGTSQVFAGGAAVQFSSDGSTLPTLNQKITTLLPSTAYAVSLWACCDSVPAAGVITVDLCDGIGGTVLLDQQGVSQSITFNASALLNNFQHLSALQTGECYFRTPAILPTSVYLRVRVSTAVTSGKSVFIDQVGLTTPTMLYAGGPLVAAFSGGNSFTTADTWQLTITNDRAGYIREWCERNFAMSQLGLLFPTSTSPTIPDSAAVAYSGSLNFVIAANSEYLPLVFL